MDEVWLGEATECVFPFLGCIQGEINHVFFNATGNPSGACIKECSSVYVLLLCLLVMIQVPCYLLVLLPDT